MAVIGPRTAIDLALPPGVDGSRILAFQMRGGKTAQQVIAEAAAMIGTVNEKIMARWRAVSFLTPLDHSIYRQGDDASETPIKVEGKQADGVRSDILGHMLPITDYEDATAWTPIYLRDAWDAQVEADLTLIGERWENRVDNRLLRRIFNPLPVAIGDSGYAVPWAIGSGTAAYIPPATSGFSAFDSSHTHFLTQTGTWNAATAALMLNAMVLHLLHHGITGRLTAEVSGADVAIYQGITGGKFVELLPAGMSIVTGGSNAIAVATGEADGAPGEIFGYFRSSHGPVVELRAMHKIPTQYAWMTKSYGANNIKNALAIREHPAKGFGMVADPQVTTSINPELDKVLFKAVHGEGVNNRLNGVVAQATSGSYEAPTW